MNKKLLLIFLLLIPLATAIQSETSNDNSLRIDFLGPDPSPLATGSTAKLNFQITNLQSRTVNNLEFQLADKFPLKVLGENLATISKLNPQETKSFSFDVTTTGGVEDGTYDFGIQYPLPTIDKIGSSQFSVSVRTVSRAIASTIITTEPEKIPPGSTGKIIVDLQNGATYAMKDIVFKLNYTDTVPIAPYGSTSEKSIKRLEPGESKIIIFDVIALPDATPNVYRLPITITYDDELGTEITKQDEVGLILTSEAEYDLGIEDSVLVKGVPSDLTLSISNIGPANIKYLSLELIPTDEYDLVKQTKEYIGNLEPDDFETAEFQIYPKKSRDITLKAKLVYKDDLNHPKEDIREIKVNVYSKYKAESLGLITNGGLSRTIFYILLVIFIYLSYKYWRKERNLPKAMKLALKGMLIAFLNFLRQLKPRNLKRLPRKIRIALIKLR